jgi:hypothetical protein
MEPRVEYPSVEGYYASFEVGRQPSDLSKTRKFKPKPDAVTTKYVRPEPENDNDGTVPFIKESAPYELLDLQDGLHDVREPDPMALIDQTDVVAPVDMEDIELPDPSECSDEHDKYEALESIDAIEDSIDDAIEASMARESIMTASLISNTVRTTPDVIVRFQRSSTYVTRPRIPWLAIGALLVSAIALGIGVSLLIF